MNLDFLNGVAVPFICGLVYILIDILKPCFSKELNNRIPLIAAVLGATIGVICYYTMHNVITLATNPIGALIIGAASGLAATGTHQIIKQQTKPKEE
ncbi:MAG: phage holin family protein [Firmicutes bacterium]|nr:phage holin family protein [Bacillota bacterium]